MALSIQWVRLLHHIDMKLGTHLRYASPDSVMRELSRAVQNNDSFTVNALRNTQKVRILEQSLLRMAAEQGLAKESVNYIVNAIKGASNALIVNPAAGRSFTPGKLAGGKELTDLEGTGRTHTNINRGAIGSAAFYKRRGLDEVRHPGFRMSRGISYQTPHESTMRDPVHDPYARSSFRRPVKPERETLVSSRLHSLSYEKNPDRFLRAIDKVLQDKNILQDERAVFKLRRKLGYEMRQYSKKAPERKLLGDLRQVLIQTSQKHLREQRDVKTGPIGAWPAGRKRNILGYAQEARVRSQRARELHTPQGGVTMRAMIKIFGGNEASWTILARTVPGNNLNRFRTVPEAVRYFRAQGLEPKHSFDARTRDFQRPLTRDEKLTGGVRQKASFTEFLKARRKFGKHIKTAEDLEEAQKDYAGIKPVGGRRRKTGDVIVPFGKYRGQRLDNVPPGYLEVMSTHEELRNTYPEFYRYVDSHVEHPRIKDELRRYEEIGDRASPADLHPYHSDYQPGASENFNIGWADTTYREGFAPHDVLDGTDEVLRRGRYLFGRNESVSLDIEERAGKRARPRYKRSPLSISPQGNTSGTIADPTNAYGRYTKKGMPWSKHMRGHDTRKPKDFDPDYITSRDKADVRRVTRRQSWAPFKSVLRALQPEREQAHLEEDPVSGESYLRRGRGSKRPRYIRYDEETDSFKWTRRNPLAWLKRLYGQAHEELVQESSVSVLEDDTAKFERLQSNMRLFRPEVAMEEAWQDYGVRPKKIRGRKKAATLDMNDYLDYQERSEQLSYGERFEKAENLEELDRHSLEIEEKYGWHNVDELDYGETRKAFFRAKNRLMGKP